MNTLTNLKINNNLYKSLNIKLFKARFKMELTFSDNYSESSLFLMEVPNSILDYIKQNKGELLIKGNEPSILCTDSSFYELKFLETSNSYLVIDSQEGSPQKKQIKLMTQHTLECCEMSPNKYHILNLLKKNCKLNYNIQTGENNFSSFKNLFTRDNLFAMCDLPRTQFNNLLNENHIFEYLPNNNYPNVKYMCIFDDIFIYDIVSSILKVIASTNKEIFSDANEIFEMLIKENTSYDKCINMLSQIEKEVILSYICDIDSDGIVSMNVDKSKVFIAKSIFFSNVSSNIDFKLNDFITLFNNAINIYLSSDIVLKIIETNEKYLLSSDCNDNLYEYYKDYDLRFLIGKCIIYMNKTFREPLIKWIEISDLSEDFTQRLMMLFAIKDKWTQKELSIFMDDLQINNLRDRVSRVAQVVPESNLFNKDKNINYLYLKKNPFFREK